MLSHVDEELLKRAEAAVGFMPRAEGLALYEAGRRAAANGPLLEVGSYRGKSSIYLGAAARGAGVVLYSIDHHRGSEEHQPGEEYHDPDVYDAARGRIDTLPSFLATLAEAGLNDVVVPLVGRSHELAREWSLPLGLVFIDGGHSDSAARADLESWAPKVAPGGLLAIHDVFEDPAAGGRPPFDIYKSALESGYFVDEGREGSLRVLERVGDRI
jgi:MMP 1-O-methyltransferase